LARNAVLASTRHIPGGGGGPLALLRQPGLPALPRRRRVELAAAPARPATPLRLSGRRIVLLLASGPHASTRRLLLLLPALLFLLPVLLLHLGAAAAPVPPVLLVEAPWELLGRRARRAERPIPWVVLALEVLVVLVVVLLVLLVVLLVVPQRPLPVACAVATVAVRWWPGRRLPPARRSCCRQRRLVPREGWRAAGAMRRCWALRLVRLLVVQPGVPAASPVQRLGWREHLDAG
jgi:hypothetical protein